MGGISQPAALLKDLALKYADLAQARRDARGSHDLLAAEAQQASEAFAAAAASLAEAR